MPHLIRAGAEGILLFYWLFHGGEFSGFRRGVKVALRLIKSRVFFFAACRYVRAYTFLPRNNAPTEKNMNEPIQPSDFSSLMERAHESKRRRNILLKDAAIIGGCALGIAGIATYGNISAGVPVLETLKQAFGLSLLFTVTALAYCGKAMRTHVEYKRLLALAGKEVANSQADKNNDRHQAKKPSHISFISRMFKVLSPSPTKPEF
jgi:hypothetical protein